MIRSLSALAVFLFLGALLLALPGVAPKVQAGEVAAAAGAPAVLAKADRLDAREASCSAQIWPDFTTSCLRHAGSIAKIQEARVVTVRR